LFRPLHLELHSEHLSLVKLLLEQGANIHAIHKWKNTPLHSAAVCGRTEVTRLLPDGGADFTSTNGDMLIPLQFAVQSGHLNHVKLLLEKGANPNTVDMEGDTTS
jgi:ankyrin repeat protein